MTLLWPLVLIAAGVALLLSNLGFVAPLDISRLMAVGWPVVLVGIGIDLALGRRMPRAAFALEALVLAGGVALVLARPGPGTALFGQAPTGEQAVVVPRDGARTLELRVTVGGGRFALRGGSAQLLEARSGRSDLSARTTRRGEVAEVRLQQSEVPLLAGGGADIEVRVASDVPTDLRVEAGAGDFTLDLADVTASEVRVQTGASNLALTLPRPAATEIPVRVESGASSIVIEVPGGVEAKVATAGGLTSTSGRTETSGYASARARVTVTVTAGASSITVR